MHLVSEYNTDLSVCVAVAQLFLTEPVSMLHCNAEEVGAEAFIKLRSWCWKLCSVGAEISVPHPDENTFGARKICMAECIMKWHLLVQVKGWSQKLDDVVTSELLQLSSKPAGRFTLLFYLWAFCPTLCYILFNKKLFKRGTEDLWANKHTNS